MNSFLDDPLAALQSLSVADQIRLLTRLTWELTIVARYYYVPGTEELSSPWAVRAVNELQHTISSQARALLEDDPHRYPDEVLITILIEGTPERDGLRDLVRQAFASAYRWVRPEAADRHPQPSRADA